MIQLVQINKRRKFFYMKKEQNIIVTKQNKSYIKTFHVTIFKNNDTPLISSIVIIPVRQN